jgi:hypothetical protein
MKSLNRMSRYFCFRIWYNSWEKKSLIKFPRMFLAAVSAKDLNVKRGCLDLDAKTVFLRREKL